MPNKKDAANTMRQKLEDNADERNHYIKMALDDLSGADKASNPAVLKKDAGDHQGLGSERGEFEKRDHHRQWSTTKAHQ